MPTSEALTGSCGNGIETLPQQNEMSSTDRTPGQNLCGLEIQCPFPIFFLFTIHFLWLVIFDREKV